MVHSKELALSKLREAGYITKKELHALEKINPRTQTEVIRVALDVWDEKVIDLLAIRHSKTGVVYYPQDITKELIDEIDSKPGIATWYVLPELGNLVRERSSKRQASPESASSPPPRPAAKEVPQPTQTVKERRNSGLPRLPRDPVEQVAVLEDFALRLLDDLSRSEQQYDDLVPVVKELPGLITDLQQSIKNAQYLSLSDEDKKRMDRFLGAATDIQTSAASTTKEKEDPPEPEGRNAQQGESRSKNTVVDVTQDEPATARSAEESKSPAEVSAKKKAAKPKAPPSSTKKRKSGKGKGNASDKQEPKKTEAKKVASNDDPTPTFTAIKRWLTGNKNG